ncbi:MAG TPA: class I SAM-dependent methyltransferase [Desulfotomaculum sp.]|nr:MAG: ubiquinone biosynthesis protein UbiE [Desulfotomaculum sp. BICA1-6]HBX23366.1 class I SAM-dependent methyltransferase [Desulfotomaculum sp.]
MSQLFDDMADSYDSWYETPSGRVVDRIEKEVIYSYLEPWAGMKVLDVGCGTGHYTLDLAAQGLDVTGVDISRPMLEQARAKAQHAGLDIQFLEADAFQLPFNDQSFDAVIAVTVLEFAPDLSTALRETLRVLKTGGRLVVGLIGRDSDWWRLYDEKSRRDPDNIFNRARFYILEELLAAMPGRDVQGKAVLFVPPDFDYTLEDQALAMETEAVKSGRTDGGFICAVAVK